jgi:ribonuclease HI
MVRAVAILRREGKPDHILKMHLGTTDQHTVYKAELVGMIMGLHLIKTERRSKVKSVLNVDNQAALVAIKSNMNKLDQHLAANLLQLAKQLLERRGNSRFKLTFRWSAGHVRITGNEDTDKKAKAATDSISSEKEELPVCLCKMLGHSLSATQQAYNNKLKHRWATTWARSPRYCWSPFQDVLTPYSQKYLKLVSSEGISRKAASIIFQLRVGHTLLNQYLHCFKKIDKLHCPACRHLKETAEHFILNCPKYTHERWPMLRLSGSRTPKFTKILASHKLIAPLTNYIEATRWFALEVENTTVSST